MEKIASDYETKELKKTPHTKWLTTSVSIQTTASFCSCVKYILKPLYCINKKTKNKKIRQQQRRVSSFLL